MALPVPRPLLRPPASPLSAGVLADFAAACDDLNFGEAAAGDGDGGAAQPAPQRPLSAALALARDEINDEHCEAVLLGANGAGKSTLVNVLLGLTEVRPPGISACFAASPPLCARLTRRWTRARMPR